MRGSLRSVSFAFTFLLLTVTVPLAGCTRSQAVIETAAPEKSLATSPKHLAQRPSSDSVYVTVDRRPQIVGGMKALRKSVSYPSKARKEGVEGRVTVQFVVDESGNTTQIEVLEPVHPQLDAAAKVGVEKLTCIPGFQDGKPVKVRFAVPINFNLNGLDLPGEYSDRGKYPSFWSTAVLLGVSALATMFVAISESEGFY